MRRNSTGQHVCETKSATSTHLRGIEKFKGGKCLETSNPQQSSMPCRLIWHWDLTSGWRNATKQRKHVWLSLGIQLAALQEPQLAAIKHMLQQAAHTCSRHVVQTCGTDTWQRHVVQTCLADIWYRGMVQTYGTDMWYRHVVETRGTHMWYRHVVQT